MNGVPSFANIKTTIVKYFFVRLQSNIQNQIRSHNLTKMIRVIEIEHDVEDAMKES